MKRPLFLTLCLALAGCVSPSGSLVEPELDGPGLSTKADGFSSLETTALRFGGESRHTVDEDLQFFAFEFEARENAVITAEVSQAGTSRGLDTTIFLYRLSDTESPSRIAVDDDDGWGPLSRIEDFRLFSEGRYAFVVGTKDSQGRGDFRVSFECLSGECAPEEPEQPACPVPMQDNLADSMLMLSYETDYELSADEVAAELIDEGVSALAYEDACDRGDSTPADCARGQRERAAACDAYLERAYPSAEGLGARVSPVTDLALSAAFGSMETSAEHHESCGAGEG